MNRNMKQITALALLLVCLLLAVSCAARADASTNNGDGENMNVIENEEITHPYFRGKVLEVYEGRALIEVTNGGNQEIPVGEKYVVNTDIKDCPEYEVGDYLRVVFDGKVALSYPGQILSVYEIHKINEDGTAAS